MRHRPVGAERTPSPPPRIFTPEYYARLRAVEETHWYVWGMRRIALALLRGHGVPPPRAVLDAGCGTGGTLRWLRTTFPGARVVGVDVAVDALRYAATEPAVTVLRSSAIELPFRDSVFDLVVSFDVLQHLPKGAGHRPALREAHRVLGPGGVLLARAAARRRHDPRGDDDYHQFTRTELSAKIEAAGFAVRQATHVNCLLSLVDEVRGTLRAHGGDHGHGGGLAIRPPRYPWMSVAQRLVMRAEAAYLARGGGRLPFGHTLILLAVKPG